MDIDNLVGIELRLGEAPYRHTRSRRQLEPTTRRRGRHCVRHARRRLNRIRVAQLGRGDRVHPAFGDRAAGVGHHGRCIGVDG